MGEVTQHASRRQWRFITIFGSASRATKSQSDAIAIDMDGIESLLKITFRHSKAVGSEF